MISNYLWLKSVLHVLGAIAFKTRTKIIHFFPQISLKVVHISKWKFFIKWPSSAWLDVHGFLFFKIYFLVYLTLNCPHLHKLAVMQCLYFKDHKVPVNCFILWCSTSCKNSNEWLHRYKSNFVTKRDNFYLGSKRLIMLHSAYKSTTIHPKDCNHGHDGKKHLLSQTIMCIKACYNLANICFITSQQKASCQWQIKKFQTEFPRAEASLLMYV